MPLNTVLLQKFANRFALEPEERDSIASIPVQLRTFPARSDVIRERDRLSQCCFVLDGIACRYKIVSDGRRQIFSFHLSGDIPDLHSLHLDTMDHCLGAVTPISVGFVPHAEMRAFLRKHPRISDVFWRDTLIEASIFRAWMAGLGVRSSYARLAHFICEIVTRLSSLDITARDARTIALPIPQSVLADALGITPVHINRTMNALRADGLLQLDNRRLTINDWDGLKAAADFDPFYLHIQRARAPLNEPSAVN